MRKYLVYRVENSWHAFIISDHKPSGNILKLGLNLKKEKSQGDNFMTMVMHI